MPESCLAGKCGRQKKRHGVTMHRFPKDQTLRRQWVRFVCLKRKDFSARSVTNASILCSLHFKPECYENWLRFQMGHASRPMLKADAVPTLHPPALMPQPRGKKRLSTGSTESESQATMTVPKPNQQATRKKYGAKHKRDVLELMNSHGLDQAKTKTITQDQSETVEKLDLGLGERSHMSTPKPKQNSSQGQQGQGYTERDIPLTMSCSEEPFVQVPQECKVKIEPDLMKTESVHLGDTRAEPSQSVTHTLGIDADVKPPVIQTEEKDTAQVSLTSEKLITDSAVHLDTESYHSVKKEESSNSSSNSQSGFELQSTASNPEALPAPYFVATHTLMAAIESVNKEKLIHSNSQTNLQSMSSKHRGSAGRSTNVAPFMIAPIEPDGSGPGVSVVIKRLKATGKLAVRDTADSPLNCEQGTDVSPGHIQSTSQGQKRTIDHTKMP